jgi:hypothetical protein
MPKLNTSTAAKPGASPPKAAKAGTARLSVPRREAVRDLSCLPEQVNNYFTSKGYRVTLASMHQTAVMQLSTDERFPLCLPDIEDEGDREEMRKALVRQGFQIKEGFPTRGDCYIYVQPERARDAQLQRGLAVWLGQDDPRALDPALTEINELFRGSGLAESSAYTSSGGSLSDHVSGWGE